MFRAEWYHYHPDMLMFGSQYLIFIHKLYGNAKTFVKYNTNETFDLMISQNKEVTQVITIHLVGTPNV